MIEDSRDQSSFKTITFSGYKKNQVFTALFKSIKSKNVETSCNWLIELIISGYIKELWEKLCLYYSKHVHINNCKLIDYTYKQNKIIKRLLGDNINQQIYLRNNQNLINILISYTIILIESKIDITYTNIKITKTDFILTNVQNKLNSQMNILPEGIVNINEPPEIKLIINEIYYHLNFKNYDKIIYWITWIIEWEKLNLKNKISWNIVARDIRVKDKYKNDVIWIIWKLIDFTKKKYDIKIINYIDKLFELFIENYDKSKRNKRMTYLFNSISLLVEPIKETKLIEKIDILIQSQCNYFMIIDSKKLHEKKDDKIINQLNENKKNISKKQSKKQCDEISKSKIDDFNEIDKILNF